jgi:hypothetical protein
LRGRPLAVILAALVVSGSATAAVITLNARSSQPLAGRVPGRAVIERPADGALSVSGYRYQITVTPDLGAGTAGWGAGLQFFGPPYGAGGSEGGGGYPSTGEPLFNGSGLSIQPAGALPHGDTVGFELTSPQVAAIRIGARTIRTFTSSELPGGDRAAVFFVAAAGPQPTAGWRPGMALSASERVPGPRPGRWNTIHTVAVLPLDGSGHVIPTTATSFFQIFSRFWQARSAVTPGNEQPAYHGPSRPLPGACELAVRGLPGLTPEFGHAVARIAPVHGALGELLESCIDTHYYLHGWPLTAAVLVDGRDPGRAPGPVPGAHAVAGDPDTVDAPAAGLSARRIGAAWLVIDGGSGTAQRLAVLRALRITRLAFLGARG